MSENVPEQATAESQALADPVRTGVADVDAVLDSLDAVDSLPVQEHVAVFERAHEGLRAALDPGPDA